MICTSPTVRLVNHCFTTHTSRTNRKDRAKRNMPLYGSYQFVYIGQPSRKEEEDTALQVLLTTKAFKIHCSPQVQQCTSFPTVAVLREKWIKFVQRHRGDFKPEGKYTSLCSAHFEASCYNFPIQLEGIQMN